MVHKPDIRLVSDTNKNFHWTFPDYYCKILQLKRAIARHKNLATPSQTYLIIISVAVFNAASRTSSAMREYSLMDAGEIVRFHKKHVKAGVHAYHGWEYCYDAFRKFNDPELLSLHLAACMGSYGMNRGKSLLRQSNYSIHLEAVSVLKNYQIELGGGGIDFNHINPDAISNTSSELIKLSKKLVCIYSKHHETIQSLNNVSGVTSTLITKVMMCSLGCVPAYDRLFMRGLRQNAMIQRFGCNSLKQVMAFCNKNKDTIEKCQKFMRTPADHPYPMMRVVDLHFWLIGANTIEEE